MNRFILAGLAFVGMGVGNAFAGGCCGGEVGHHGCCYPCGGGCCISIGYGPAVPATASQTLARAREEGPGFRPQWYLEYPCAGEWYNQGVNPWHYFGATAADYGCAQPDVSNRPYYWYSK